MSRATSSGDIGPSEPFRSQIGYEDKDTDPGAKNSTTVSSTISDSRFAKIRNNGLLQRCWAIVSWTPSGCRWDPENPPKFSIALNLLFAVVSWPWPFSETPFNTYLSLGLYMHWWISLTKAGWHFHRSKSILQSPDS
jgi:hypothetical protein